MNDLANKIMDIQTKVYNDFGVHSAPMGDKYILMVLSMAEEIIRTVHIEDVTPEIQKIIECNNCHMVANALDLVLQVRKYDCHEYIENPHNIENTKEYIDLSDNTPHIEFEDIEPIYTGGGIWCFVGELSDSTFFIAEDANDSFRIVNEDPRGNEEAWYPEWQEKHLVLDIDDDKTTPIFIDLYRWLESHKANCGIDFQAEIEERQEY